MNKKLKVAINLPRVNNWNRRARKHAKKYEKIGEEDKYSIEWRTNFVTKRMKKLLKVLDVELEVKGYDNLPKPPAILAPNHASSMDPGLMLIALENPDPSPDARDGYPIFLAKDDIKKDKRARGHAKLLNTFYINRKNPRDAIIQIDNMAAFSKKEKRYQVIFPEGTRTKDGNMGVFKGGAFRSAKKSFSPIVPVTINNTLSITDLSRTGKLKVQIIFHKPIKPMSFMTKDNKAIAEAVQKQVKKGWVKPEGKRSNHENKS